MNSLIDYIASILVRALNIIFRLVPIGASLWLGRRLGGIAFFFNRKRRLVAYTNLKAAFAREKPPAELRRLTKDVYVNLVQTFVEILNLTKVNKQYINKYVEVVNLERIQNAARSGRGVILLTAHFGDWELSNLASAMIGFPITVLVREQKMERLNELLNRLRESKGCKVVRKGMSTKNILKALYDKEIIGILSDQDAGRNGVFVDFFGRPTSCHVGPMEMAKRTDSIIIPNFIVRTKGPYHKVYLEEYIDFRGPESAGGVKEGLEAFARILESYVRRYPAQWLWLHKRWKSTPARTVLVLNDGKQGHLNQSLAVANEIRKARTTQGYGVEDTKITVIDVRFKNRFASAALSVCASFASWRCHGCMRCVKATLDRNTYGSLMRTYAEFIISCGSSLAPVNVFMAKENNAKNIVVMKPNGIARALGKFSLVIIPKHDRPREAKNVVVTDMAPNIMDEERLKSDGGKLKNRIGHVKTDAIGVFFGGDNPEFSLTEDIASVAIDNILKFCEANDSELLVTTSRRTPPGIERVIEKRLKDEPRCKLLVLANEKNLGEAVGGILALSKIAVISGESVSMISEAVGSGRKVIAFELEKRVSGVTKHEAALKELEREGYASVAAPENLKEALEAAWKDTRPAKEPKDREKIFDAVRRLI